MTIRYDPTNSNRMIVTKVQTGTQFTTRTLYLANHSGFFSTNGETEEALMGRAMNFAKRYIGKEFQLKMRTFEAAMYGVSTEEDGFRTGAARDPHYIGMTFGITNTGPFAMVKRPDGPIVRVNPIMTLTYAPGEILPPLPLTKLSYRNKTYFVGDQAGSDQNRVAFTILNYLFAQASVSTQNLPVQQLIQVH
jgi:hypothetical protein